MSLERALIGTTDAGGSALYVEDVFSTYLYKGNGATQTITNGIDLAGKGGLVWLKCRDTALKNVLVDTARGTASLLSSDSSAAADTSSNASDAFSSFNALGFTLASNSANYWTNHNPYSYSSWTFRKQAKFFDVVTYTGNGTTQNIAHNLGSVPGCMIVKQITGMNLWSIYHRGVDATNPQNYGLWFQTNARDLDTYWNNTAPTSTVFTVGPKDGTNQSGSTYVAYLFAHNAGGFGASGSDSIISCGSYTGPANVNLGWEPQWVLTKKITNNNAVLRDWMITDVMRGLKTSAQYGNGLFPNTSGIETTNNEGVYVNSTGFTTEFDRAGSSGETYIYIAIRRPMKTPTSGASVFKPLSRTGTGAANKITGIGFTPDALICRTDRNGTIGYGQNVMSRLTGSSYLSTQLTGAEASMGALFTSWDMDGITVSGNNYLNYTSGGGILDYYFRRARGFFDVVCYTGTGTASPINHALGVIPDLILVKDRNGTSNWLLGSSKIASDGLLYLNTNQALITGFANAFSATSTTFTPTYRAASGTTYVAYLFSSCAGVSKIGTYTGNGSSQTINCGFAAGARFILIKPTTFAADWFVWDTARGIVSTNDPHLSLNTTAAEVATDDSIDPDSTGFIVNQVTGLNLNVVTEIYLYLAIA